jgi:excisionase family DNA binding protein
LTLAIHREASDIFGFPGGIVGKSKYGCFLSREAGSERQQEQEHVPMAGAVEQMLREVLDIRQAAEYLGISADTLYRYASEGFVPAFRLGNRWRFKRSLLDAWMVKMSGAKAPSNVTVMPREKKPAGRAR